MNSQPQKTLEDKLVGLEAKFAALEEKYHDLYQKASSPSGGIITTQLSSANETKKEEEQLEGNKTGPVSRAKISINTADPLTGERKDHPPSESVPSQVTDASYAFTLRKNVYKDEDEDNNAEINIINEHLWNLLKGLLGQYPHHIFRGLPVTIDSPFEPLIYFWDELQQATRAQPKDDNDRQARSDLRLLLDTISSSSGDPKLDKYFRARESNKEQKSVTFDTLWTIFPPGSLIYGQPFQGQDQVFIVQDSITSWPSYGFGRPLEQATWSLLCWIYDWDGKKFRRMGLKLNFEYFDGAKPIISLPYHPFELHEGCAVIKAHLIKQGVDYRRICTETRGSRMFEYNGEAILAKKGFSGAQGDDEDDDISGSSSGADVEFFGMRWSLPSSQTGTSTTKTTKVESRVMVDFESYFRYGPSIVRVGSLSQKSGYPECTCIDCRENEPLQSAYRTRFDEESRQQGEWEDEQYMLCPPRVLGYVLRDKQWAQLQVSVLKIVPKVDPNDSWSRLKLADGEKTKTMILDLVKGHASGELPEKNALEVDDIISKKGKGLVILLYGPPGIGKTSTAETVAIASRKPLFAISVADVGTQAKNAEANLAKIFALAASWQAILLIDEADVFLESRGKGITSNTERNALVSVFLRVLEYYQGILMLTTNQIAQFDVAVQSRIHVAIKYLDLNHEQTTGIFQGFLDPLDKKGLVKEMREIKDWLEEDVINVGLDGRQIRNIVTSALGLARAEKSDRLEKRHIKTVLNKVKDFKTEFLKQFEKYKVEQQGMMG